MRSNEIILSSLHSGRPLIRIDKTDRPELRFVTEARIHYPPLRCQFFPTSGFFLFSFKIPSKVTVWLKKWFPLPPPSRLILFSFLLYLLSVLESATPNHLSKSREPVRSKDHLPFEQKSGEAFNTECKKCNAKKIGETGRKLDTRLKEYRKSVFESKPKAATSRHFESFFFDVQNNLN